MAEQNNTLDITDAIFSNEIQSYKPVLVDFWAPWCGPCRTMNPIIEELATAYKGKAGIYKLNIDDNAQTTAAYHVRSVPTLIIFKDGQLVDRMMGVQTKSDLTKKLDAYL